ncbi:hypothetical protein [Sphingomonas sp. LM7]|uniref:hypothetical protein n=1 Tax=Sphingomonas sp. LM7 TaxID=1938607 RepID=UPI000983F599|nr:hypothetical protein [Sphingomonas sp. LM7]AQR75098.1 hypothetical protein BXU08_16800 [Sphingomonas sp. LM7]
MRKLIALIASLMLVLTLWSGFQASAAYASEATGCVAVAADAYGHAPGDADEVRGDSDKAAPHHHNVSHSHELGIPVSDWIDVAFVRTSLQSGIGPGVPPAAFASHRDLRPPIA